MQTCLLGRQETAEIKKKPGLAKIVGTIVCVCGAMLLSFYHGSTIGLGESNIHWTYVESLGDSDSSSKSNFIVGPVFLMLSTVGWALWFIIQVNWTTLYFLPDPYPCQKLPIEKIFHTLCSLWLFSGKTKREVPSSILQHCTDVFHGQHRVRGYRLACWAQDVRVVIAGPHVARCVSRRSMLRYLLTAYICIIWPVENLVG